MKKIFVLTFAVFLLVFSGCSKEEQAVELKIPYECSLSIKSDTDENMSYKAVLKRIETGWQMEYSAPENVAGMKITFDNENYKISMEDLELNASKNELPDSAVSTMIVSALDNASLSANVKYETNDGMTVAKGTVSETDYEISFKNEAPKTLKISNLTITFESFKNL